MKRMEMSKCVKCEIVELANFHSYVPLALRDLRSHDNSTRNANSRSQVRQKLNLIGELTLVQYSGIILEFVLFYVGMWHVSLVGMLYVVASIVSATYREATASHLWKIALVFATILSGVTYIMQLGTFQNLFTTYSKDRFLAEWAGFVREAKCANTTIEDRVLGGKYVPLPSQVFEHLAVVAAAALQGYAQSYLKGRVDAVYENADIEDNVARLRSFVDKSKTNVEEMMSSDTPLPLEENFKEDRLADEEQESKRPKLQRTDAHDHRIRVSEAVEAIILPYKRQRESTTTERARKHRMDWSKDIQLIRESFQFWTNSDDSIPIFEAIEFTLRNNVIEAYIRVFQNMYTFASLECAILALVLAAYWRASGPSLVYLGIIAFAISFPRRVVDEWWQYAVLVIMLAVIGQSGFIVFYPFVQCVTSTTGAECTTTALSAASSGDPLFIWLSVVYQEPGLLIPDLLAFIFASQHLNQLYSSEPSFYELKPSCAFASLDFEMPVKLKHLTNRLGYLDFMNPEVRKTNAVCVPLSPSILHLRSYIDAILTQGILACLFPCTIFLVSSGVVLCVCNLPLLKPCCNIMRRHSVCELYIAHLSRYYRSSYRWPCRTNSVEAAAHLDLPPSIFILHAPPSHPVPISSFLGQ